MPPFFVEIEGVAGFKAPTSKFYISLLPQCTPDVAPVCRNKSHASMGIL